MNNDNTFSWQGYQPEETSHRLVAAYLAVDIQRNIEETNNLLQKIDAISKREIPNWERIGNAYYLRLFPEYAEIEEEFSDGTCGDIKYFRDMKTRLISQGAKPSPMSNL